MSKYIFDGDLPGGNDAQKFKLLDYTKPILMPIKTDAVGSDCIATGSGASTHCATGNSAGICGTGSSG